MQCVAGICRMNNQVAAPCCGSCLHWDDNHQYCKEHNDYAQGSHLNCEGEDYSPRNPIPIIDLPEVKELIEVAYRAGFNEADPWPHSKKVMDWYVSEYIKALETRP